MSRPRPVTLFEVAIVYALSLTAVVRGPPARPCFIQTARLSVITTAHVSDRCTSVIFSPMSELPLPLRPSTTCFRNFNCMPRHTIPTYYSRKFFRPMISGIILLCSISRKQGNSQDVLLATLARSSTVQICPTTPISWGHFVLSINHKVTPQESSQARSVVQRHTDVDKKSSSSIQPRLSATTLLVCSYV